MKGKFLICGGVLLVAASLCLTGYNLLEERRAGDKADEIMQQYMELLAAASQQDDTSEAPEGLSGEQSDSEDTVRYFGESYTDQYGLRVYEYSPETAMPTVEVEGELYIGILDIPALGVSLPVMEEWSYAHLKAAPCRYKGSVNEDNIIIAGHNYKYHFGGLRELDEDDEVIFTDVEGNQYKYRVSEVTKLAGTEVDEMEAGDWALTLFTCTTDSQNRVTVRCVRAE